ncbi:hypothetical protein GQX74_003612 [Glossina fuscipes]|nr:hypothetical protein GQX74_003612 [Glossina fuscipes]
MHVHVGTHRAKHIININHDHGINTAQHSTAQHSTAQHSAAHLTVAPQYHVQVNLKAHDDDRTVLLYKSR